MSTYKPTGSSLYIYDFRRGNRRFFGPTGESTKAAADAVERAEIEKAEESVRKQKALKRAPMSVDVAFGRYWEEVGRHAASAGDIEATLAFWLDQLGKSKRLDDVTDDDVAHGIIVRRKAQVRCGTTPDGKPIYKEIANATVNRSTQILRRVFRRADDVWNVLLVTEPKWGRHLLPEPEQRVREATYDEEDALFESVRDDYHDLMEFAFVTGLRRKASLITKAQVDWENRRIRYQKKRKRAGQGVVWRYIPITAQIEAILRRVWDHHPVYVFTYVCRRPRTKKQVKGKRYPITPQGLKSQFRRGRAKSGVIDFRWHDIRHTTGSRTTRGSRNLAAVQKLLGHEDIKTTMKYVHVLDDDIADALEATARDVERRRESQEKSQGGKKKQA